MGQVGIGLQKDGVRVLGEGEIAVNLIGDHEHAIFLAQVAHLAQLVLCPHPTDRIVRAAQEQHLHGFVLNLGFQVVKVHLKLAVPLHQRIFHQLPAVIAHHIVERIVYWRLHQNTITRLGQGTDGDGQGKDHAGGLYQPRRLCLPAEAAGKPVGQSGIVVRLGAGVAKDAVVNALPQSVQHRLGGGEIHICYPQGQHVCRAALRYGKVKFQAVGVPAVDEPVKIVTHGNASFY